jgi:hypothetical protein
MYWLFLWQVSRPPATMSLCGLSVAEFGSSAIALAVAFVTYYHTAQKLLLTGLQC